MVMIRIFEVIRFSQSSLIRSGRSTYCDPSSPADYFGADTLYVSAPEITPLQGPSSPVQLESLPAPENLEHHFAHDHSHVLMDSDKVVSEKTFSNKAAEKQNEHKPVAAQQKEEVIKE